MKNSTLLCTVVLAIGLSGQAMAGPFGLEKGMTLKQIDNAQQVAPGKYKVTSVPKPHSAFDTYAVQIGPQSGLCWIKGVGKELRTSVYGLELRSAFNEMKEKLEQAYGKPEVIDRLLPGSIWDEPKDWMMALIKKERLLAAAWSEKSKATLPIDLQWVGLGARAISTNSGYIAVEYSFINKSDCDAEIAKQEDGAL